MAFVCAVVYLLSYFTVNQIKVWQDSEIFWRYVISASPKTSSEVYGNLGVSHARKGRLDEAISKYKKALAINPNHAKIHSNLGAAYAQKGRLDEAITEYKKALTINPNLAEPHYNLGNVYAKEGRLNEATSAFKKAIAVKPNLVDAYYKLGLVLEAQGELRDAISAYREVIRLKPDHNEAYNNLAWIYATSPNGTIRNGEEAVTLATKACELMGFKKAEGLDTLAAAYAEQGNFRKAVEYQLRAMELSSPQINKGLQKRLQLYKVGRSYQDQ